MLIMYPSLCNTLSCWLYYFVIKRKCPSHCQKKKKKVYIVIPRTCRYVTIYGRRNFEDMIELRILRWRDTSVLSGWVQCHLKGLDWGRQEGQGQRKDWLCRRRGQWNTLGMEEGPWAQERRRPLEARKGKEMDSSLELTEGTQPGRYIGLRLHSSRSRRQ